MQRLEDHSHIDKAMRISRREEFAIRFLTPLFNSLQPILTLAVILFVVGLLYQLWSISLSSGTKNGILIFTSSFECFLITSLAGFVAFTIGHGTLFDESPFANSLSAIFRRLIPKLWIRTFSPKDYDLKQKYKYFCQTVKKMFYISHLDRVSTVPLLNTFLGNDEYLLGLSTITLILQSDASRRAKKTLARSIIFQKSGRYSIDGPELGNDDVSRGDDPENHERWDSIKALVRALRSFYDELSRTRDEFRNGVVIAIGCCLSQDVEREIWAYLHSAKPQRKKKNGRDEVGFEKNR